jgi:hypothetical protein
MTMPRARKVCIAGLVLFVALSITDFVQTYVLVETGGGRVREGNPVAAEWLGRFGWRGLAFFKFGTVAIVVGVVVLLMARNHDRIAAWVAGFACVAALGVTLYSRHLLTR